MSRWEVKGPVARIRWADPDWSFSETLTRLPGLKQKGGEWFVPYNALPLVDLLSQTQGHEVASVSWAAGASPLMPLSWPEIEQQLKEQGEVEPFVLDGYLMPYQREALVHGWHRAGVHYWHPTGSGKTLTGILCGLSVLGPLVIVTRAASRIQYGREVEKFTRLRAYVLRPESQMRKRSKRIEEYLAECAEKQARPVVITSWESLQDNLPLLSGLNPGAVIYDESHRGKDSKRWEVVPLPETSEDPDELLKQKAVWEREAKAKEGFVKKTDDGWRMFVPYVSTASAAAQLARQARKRICTTATPIKDRVRDLYGQLDLAEPNAWGSATDWLNRYADRKPGIYGGYDTRGSSNIEELNLRLQTVAHILDYRETHRDLPAKRRQSVYVPAEDQCRPSAGFNKELREAAKRGPGAMLEVKLARAASMKRTAVLALVESHVDSNQKVVVFTGRKEDCEKLGEQVRKNASVKNKKASVWVSHGGDSTKMRQAIIDEYMSHPGPCVLVATGHAFGESLNLHDTDAALFVMLPYDPGQFRQWEGRFTRLGQKRPVVIYYVIAEGTVDERIAGILIDKLPAVEKIAKDEELAAAGDVLAGYDGMDKDTFAESVLADLDLEGLE